jgi:flagellar basal-body rod protein FlgC
MDYNAAFQISASGMAVEKLRLDVTAANIANMNTAAASAGQAFRPLKVVAQTIPLAFARHFGAYQAAGGTYATAVPTASTPRLVHEPGHPYANAQGMVAYPSVDHTAEMLALNVALRTYEANVVAMSAARTMAARTLDIGGQQ